MLNSIKNKYIFISIVLIITIIVIGLLVYYFLFKKEGSLNKILLIPFQKEKEENKQLIELEIKNINWKLPSTKITKKIPKQIHLIYKKNRIPKYILEQYKLYAKGYKVNIYDFIDCRKIIKKYLGQKGVNIFRKIKTPAHKADFARYIILYFKGGVYFDIKILLIKPIDEIFVDKTKYYACISLASERKIFNAILASPKGNPVFKKAFKLFFKYVQTNILNTEYLKVCRDLYRIINNSVKQDRNIQIGQNGQWILFREFDDCTYPLITTKDRLGHCILIKNKKKQVVFLGRDPKYPY